MFEEMLLTKEEIAKIIHDNLAEQDKELEDYNWMVTDTEVAIAKAQLDKIRSSLPEGLELPEEPQYREWRNKNRYPSEHEYYCVRRFLKETLDAYYLSCQQEAVKEARRQVAKEIFDWIDSNYSEYVTEVGEYKDLKLQYLGQKQGEGDDK